MHQQTVTPAPWHPSADEVAGILNEMRPIIADFTRRAAAFLASAAPETTVRQRAFAVSH